MARSSYIYTVIGVYGHVIAAFTVKHELISYLHRQPPGMLLVMDVQRLRDGGREAFNVADYWSAATYYKENS